MEGPPSIPAEGASELEAKLLDALERLAEAQRVLLWRQANRHGLSPIQLQMLQFAHHEPARRTHVTALAQRFNLTKATVSVAVATLEKKGLLLRTADPADQRRQHLATTDAGNALAAQLADLNHPLLAALRTQPPDTQATTAAALIDVLTHLVQQGVITVPRMCATCRHYRQPGQPGYHEGTGHFCAFLKLPLLPAQRRLNCLDWQAPNAHRAAQRLPGTGGGDGRNRTADT